MKFAASVFSVSGTLGGHSMNQSSMQVLVRIKHNGSAGKRGWLVILQRHKEIAEMFWQHFCKLSVDFSKFSDVS